MEQEPRARPDVVTAKRFLTTAVAWLAGGVPLGYFYTAFELPFIPVGGLLWLAWVGLGLVLAGLSVAAAVRPRPSRRLRIATACLIVAALAGSRAFGPSLVRFGDRDRFRREFDRNLPLYRSIVADIERRQGDPVGASYQGVRYEVEPGPPLRVAFPLPGGILDNWEGIVYDPSDEISVAHEIRPDLSNWDEPRFVAIRLWFGGDLRYAERVSGHFYRCWFT